MRPAADVAPEVWTRGRGPRDHPAPTSTTATNGSTDGPGRLL